MSDVANDLNQQNDEEEQTPETADYQGTAGTDIILGSDDGGDDYIAGGDDTDFLFGGSGNDTIDGGAGHDLIFGGKGDDVIDAGTGHNFVDGGEGADTFVVQAGQTLTTIQDFTGGDDQIDLSNISSITGFDDLTISDADDFVFASSSIGEDAM